MTKSRRFLSITTAFILIFMATFAFAQNAFAITALAVTGVGRLDSNPKEAMVDWGNGCSLLQVSFNQNFYNPAAMTDNNNTTKMWVQSELGDFIKVNGKTVSEWNSGNGFNSVQIHVRNSVALGGQYLEFNFDTTKIGCSELPLMIKDSSVEFLAGFPMYGGSPLVTSVKYVYTVENGNIPFIKQTASPLMVTGVGRLDNNPKEAMVDWGNGCSLLQVSFNQNFYNPAAMTDANNTSKMWVQGELGDYIKVNGKTVSEWNSGNGFNSVQIHVKNSISLGGQYLELNFDTTKTGCSELPLMIKDSSVEFLAGFPMYGGSPLATSVKYDFTAENGNIPFVLYSGDVTPPPVNSTVGIIGVGCFDNEPLKGLADFGTARLFQVKFSGDFYNTANLTNGNKQWIQSEFGDYIKINGKTVKQWNVQEFNSVQIHVKTSVALGGQYLEVNTTNLEGLPKIGADCTIIFLKGFPIYEGDALANSVAFKYTANNNVPFASIPVPTDETNNSNNNNVQTGGNNQIDECSVVKGVGIFDQTPNKGIQDFGSARLIQVTFYKNFYNPANLTGGTKQWIQGEFGKYIKINGKTVDEWNAIQFNSVQIHVKTSASFGGQYLEINFTNLAGLPLVTTDNTIEFLKGFPIYNSTALKSTVVFTYKANNNVPFDKKIANPSTSDQTNILFVTVMLIVGLSGFALTKKKNSQANNKKISEGCNY